MSRVLLLSADPAFKIKNMEVLSKAGLEVTEVEDCLQGLTFLNKDKYDIIVIDSELSDISGSQACRIIREKSGVRIILLGTIEVMAKAGELGFDLFLRRRVSPGELLACVQTLLQQPVVERKPLLPQSAPEPPDTEKTVMQLPPNARPQISPAKPRTLLSRIFGQPKVSEAPTEKPLPTTPLAQEAQQVQQIQQRPSQLPSQEQVSKGKPHIASETAKPVPTARELEEAGLKTMLPSCGHDVPPKKSEQEDKNLKRREDTAPEVQPAAGAAELATIFDDFRALKLIDALVNGKLNDITPAIDFNLKAGYSYPAVEGLIDTSEQDTVNILNTLADAGVLIRQPYEKFYVDPEGGFQLVPVEHCPRDDSSNLIKGQLVEHFACGYVGLDRDFRQESKYICPKCRKEMRLIGTDYRNIGMHYRCQDDGEVFTTPVIKWRNLKTRKEWTVEELKDVDVYSFRFNPDKRAWLEFQLKPKTQLVDFLKARGYEVQEYAQLTGRSGAVHTLDVLAVRNDILTKINLGIGILAAGPGETEVSLEALFRFDTRAYDIGLNYKVVIAIPKLGPEATSFASRQMINAFEARTLAAVVSDITGMQAPHTCPQSGVVTGDKQDPGSKSAAGNDRSLIVKFLCSRGYDVYDRALITGKSGIEHVLDIFARRDDKIIAPTIAIGVVDGANGQPVGMDAVAIFDAAAFDCGIRNKVFLGLPEIGLKAKQFAKQQRIDVIEQKDLDKLV